MVFRIGLLGASKIAPGAVIAPAKANPNFEVVAVGARDADRAKAYAETHGIAHVASSYAELVRRDDVDVVYNALPPAGHLEWTIAALEAGKAVLCEKPFAMNAGEAQRMVNAAKSSGSVLIEAFHYRYHSMIREAEALIRAGELGAIRRGSAVFNVNIARSPDELRWRAELGGGGLMDLGCYPIHALRTLIGEEPDVRSASGAFEGRVDTQISAELGFPGGASATVGCAMVTDAISATLTLEGGLGRMEISPFIAPQRRGRLTTTIGGQTTVREASGPSSYEAQLIHLGEVLSGRTTPLTGGADAVANMTVIDAIYAAAGRPGL
jgi:predicted dehydrogenase